ncbi:hypothetical protein LX32DRAFT_68312 [Colletotrichum zoysiae]|uniref:Uncharacterized protein n=1 Tax=Colletotrichum zoysiae TaxID=1216348 RepID=A0AAD9HAP0_9PEZI|nr:hypothetical protein LX32DRAFT_68312 [Colletotrichum zoysiae]
MDACSMMIFIPPQRYAVYRRFGKRQREKERGGERPAYGTAPDLARPTCPRTPSLARRDRVFLPTSSLSLSPPLSLSFSLWVCVEGMQVGSSRTLEGCRRARHQKESPQLKGRRGATGWPLLQCKRTGEVGKGKWDGGGQVHAVLHGTMSGKPFIRRVPVIVLLLCFSLSRCHDITQRPPPLPVRKTLHNPQTRYPHLHLPPRRHPRGGTFLSAFLSDLSGPIPSNLSPPLPSRPPPPREPLLRFPRLGSPRDGTQSAFFGSLALSTQQRRRSRIIGPLVAKRASALLLLRIVSTAHGRKQLEVSISTGALCCM